MEWMAAEPSERNQFFARDTTSSLSSLGGTCGGIFMLKPCCDGRRELVADLKDPENIASLRMDEDSKDCLLTGSVSSQTQSLSQQLSCSEISSDDIFECNFTINQSTSLKNGDTGSSSILLSSAITGHSRDPIESQSSGSCLSEDDNSSLLPQLVYEEDLQPFRLSSIGREPLTTVEGAAKIDVADGKYGQPERTASSTDNEQHEWIPLVESALLNSSDNVHSANIDQRLSKWNDSPFVSSFSNHCRRLDVTREEWSSQGLPWHIDLHKVVTGDMVATGSYGMVFKGIYKDEKVAVKMLLIPEVSSKDELHKLKANFLQEIDLWYTLSHPNIVQFIGAYVVPPRWAIVTEFLHGGSLRAFLGRQQLRKLTQTTVHAMALDIARGMEYLHQNSIMHRDLKSGNLLLDENGTVKVADFGLARFEAEDPGNLTAETGTIRWMAPEVICHMPYTRKIDVYSYGIVLWELCTSLVPFEGMSFVQLAHAVANDHHRPPTSDLPSCFVNLMRQCWDKEPTKRPDFAAIVKYLEMDFIDGSKCIMKAGQKTKRPDLEARDDHYTQPTISMRGGRVLGRSRSSGPSYMANVDDALSDEEEWVSIRRQCRCTIL